ncbi:hypothetical protein OsI_32397 [Oryza sativa Indica Group]|uniref:EGF-like domain-containing protein n=1 Tax=Oryza sativa subsp. indica TaxID=39946 RepID=B8BEK5_ORYSI|nr:hypothetical protein OsI_32397 [Oryza sativa Indica Group]
MVMFPSPATAALLALLLLQLQLQLWSVEAQVAVGSGPPPGCPDRCGDVKVPFPFGIRDGCSLAGFGLTCNNATNPPRLMVGNGTLQVVEILLSNSTLRAVDITGAANVTFGTDEGNGTWRGVGNGTWGSPGDGLGGPYVVSEDFNRLYLTGCNIQVTLVGSSGNVITGCSSYCPIDDMYSGSASAAATTQQGSNKCPGIGCCETSVNIGRPFYGVKYKVLDREKDVVPKAVRIAERGWFERAAADLLNGSEEKAIKTPVPVVLEWAVASTGLDVILTNKQDSNWSCPTAGEARKSACLSTHSSCRNITGSYRSGYACQCRSGYAGNPYVAGGCQDINECERAQEYGCFGECTNTPGSFICRCPRGARGNATIPNGCTKSNLGN